MNREVRLQPFTISRGVYREDIHIDALCRGKGSLLIGVDSLQKTPLLSTFPIFVPSLSW